MSYEITVVVVIAPVEPRPTQAVNPTNVGMGNTVSFSKDNHHLEKNDDRNRAHGKKRCRNCASKKSDNCRNGTLFHCKECQVPLCKYPCFEEFHRRLNY